MALRSRPRRRSPARPAWRSSTAIPSRAQGGAVYNAVRLVGRDGQGLANYRKCHLFGDLDRAMFRAGAGPSALVDLGGVRIGLLICYDVEFPESVRLLALAGADLVAVPTALMDPFEVVARTVVPARAVENQVFLAYANRCGREGDLRYCGQSCVVGPDGADLARAGRGEELILADLDLERLAASRRDNTYLADRRPELYGPLGRRPHASRRRCRVSERLNQPLGGNEMPRFGGPGTMMRLPAQATAEGLDACFVGVPLDIGTSNRSGTRFGPRQIRAESALLRPYNMATRAAPFDSLQVADIGDVRDQPL